MVHVCRVRVHADLMHVLIRSSGYAYLSEHLC